MEIVCSDWYHIFDNVEDRLTNSLVDGTVFEYSRMGSCSQIVLLIEYHVRIFPVVFSVIFSVVFLDSSLDRFTHI